MLSLGERHDWLPRQHASVNRQQLPKIDAALAGFARGAATVCLLQPAFCALTTGQLLQDYVLTPRLISDQVGLHPL